MRADLRRTALFVAILLIVPVVLSQGPVEVFAFGKLDCNLPPFLGVSTKPNFLIVMDSSGSMQELAAMDGGGSGHYTHVPSGESWTASNCSDAGRFRSARWNPAESYFGPFDVNKFYKYIEPSGADGGYFLEYDNSVNNYTECELPSPPQVDVKGVMIRTDNSRYFNTVCFVTDLDSSPTGDDPSDHFSKGENVKISGLTGIYSRFNDRDLKIAYVGSASYGGGKAYIRCEVTPEDYAAVPNPDNVNTDCGPGLATREARGTTGDLTKGCVSGHILNWMVTSRVDASKIALVGGKGKYVTHTDGTRMYERGLEGLRIARYDYRDFEGAFYRRTGAQFSDNTHHPTHYRFGEYHDKDVYLTIANVARGELAHRIGVEIVGIVFRSGSNFEDQVGFVTALDPNTTGAPDPDDFFSDGDEIIITGMSTYTQFNGNKYTIEYVGDTDTSGATYYIRCSAPAEYAAWSGNMDQIYSDTGLASNSDLRISGACAAPAVVASPVTYSQTTHIGTRTLDTRSIIFCNETDNPDSFISYGQMVHISGTGYGWLDGLSAEVQAVGGPWVGNHYYVRIKQYEDDGTQNFTDAQWNQIKTDCGDLVDNPIPNSGIVLENLDESQYTCAPDPCNNPCTATDTDNDSVPDTCVCGGDVADLWTFSLDAAKEVRIDLDRADQDGKSSPEEYDPKLMLYKISSDVKTPTEVAGLLRSYNMMIPLDPATTSDDIFDLTAGQSYLAGQNNDRDNYIDDTYNPSDLILDDDLNAVGDKDSTLWSKGMPNGESSAIDSSYLSSGELQAGTYVVVVTTAQPIYEEDGNMDYLLYTNDKIKLHEVPHYRADGRSGEMYDYSRMSNMGTIFDARVRVRLPEEEGIGFVQDAAPYVRFGWMTYSTHNGERGDLMAVCKERFDNPSDANDDLDQFVDLIKGKWTDSGGTVNYGKVPWGGTPSGPALGEAYDYFAREDLHNGIDNSHSIPVSEWGDPYVDPQSSGQPDMEVPCRKSVAILISDGEWNDGWDPMATAWELRTGNLLSKSGSTYTPGSPDRGDLRPGFPAGLNFDESMEKQLAKVYTIFAFGGDFDSRGADSMKMVAAFGAFTDRTQTECGGTEITDEVWVGDGFPYPFSGIPTDSSLSLDWPLDESPWDQKCDPGTNYDECCREWDSDDEITDEENKPAKGIPDDFYLANDAQELRDAMKAILADLLQNTAAAGAVATVSQEVRGGDLLIRAAFEAENRSYPSHYAWYGHLEGYWPFMKDGYWTWEFDQQPGKLCHEMEALSVMGQDMLGNDIMGSNCWDSAEITWKWINEEGGHRKVLVAKHTVNDNLTPSDESDDFLEKIDLASTKNNLMPVPENDIYGSTNETLWSMIFDENVSATDSGELGNLMNWIKGVGSASDEIAWGFKPRFKWIHGDIVYSTPVVGGIPPIAAISNKDTDENATLDDGYQGYHRYRNSVVNELYSQTPVADPSIDEVIKRVTFVGANDGMLHAVVTAVWDPNQKIWLTQRPRYEDDTIAQEPYVKYIGRELWSFIPSTFLDQMKEIANHDYSSKTADCPPAGKGEHRNMVDLTPRLIQAYIRPPGGCDPIDDPSTPGDDTDTYTPDRCWRSVLVGGLRGGGDVYFALDVTDVDEPRLLWEYSVIEDLVLMDYDTTNSYYTIRKPTELTDNYEDFRFLPMSWNVPFAGRIELPDNAEIYVGDAPDSASPYANVNTLATFDQTLGGDVSKSDYSGHKRHVAFIPCRFQLYDQSIQPAATVSVTDSSNPEIMELLRQPHFIALDIETGQNLFKYIWPSVYNMLTPTPFPTNVRHDKRVPCSFAPPSSVDVWSNEASMVGDDGYLDHVIMGDTCGNLWIMKFINFFKGASDFGLRFDLWPTRAVPNDPDQYPHPNPDSLGNYKEYEWSNYRTNKQPITAAPGVSISPKDDFGDQKLVVIVGTGKYDDTFVAPSDKEDPATMSLYNLQYPITMDTSVYDTMETLSQVGTFPLYFQYHGLDRADMFSSAARINYFDTLDLEDYGNNGADPKGCQWVRPGSDGALAGERDCCHVNAVGNSCDTNVTDWWSCVYDFTLPYAQPWNIEDKPGESPLEGATTIPPTGLPGERVIQRPLIVNKYVLIPTFVPPTNICEPSGHSYLYIFNYMCNPLPEDYEIPTDLPYPGYYLFPSPNTPGPGNGNVPVGAVIDLGSGMVSEGQISGASALFQNSDGTIKSVPVPDPPKVQIRGWREVISE